MVWHKRSVTYYGYLSTYIFSWTQCISNLNSVNLLLIFINKIAEGEAGQRLKEI